MKRIARVISVLCVPPAVLFAPVALADTLQTRAFASIVSGGAPARDSEEDTTPPLGNVSAAASGTNQFGASYSGTASAFVDASNYGELRLSGAANMNGSGQASARSSITIIDTWTLDVLGLTNSQGVITVSLLLDGSFDANNNATSGSASAKQFLEISKWVGGLGTVVLTENAQYDDPGNTIFQRCSINGVLSSLATDCFRLYTVDIPFSVGAVFDLRMIFSGSADAVTNSITSFADSEYNLANSLYWGGINEVRVGGNVVTDYSFSSDSGFDWRQSFIPTNGVPEPSTLALIGIGLASLMAARRREL